MDDLRYERGWHVQVSYREWVRWGYGDPPGGGHVSPANVHIDLDLPGGGTFPMDFPFELPDGYDPTYPPREYERLTCWGWRFKSNDLVHDTNWRLVASREKAIAEAQVRADHEAQRKGGNSPFLRALDDVRDW